MGRQPRMSLRRSLVLSLSLSLLLSAACAREPAPGAGAGAFGTREGAIVGGQTESGWLGVGALTLDFPYYGYQGSFCTATLIAPQWVLTAAHCLLGDPQQGFVPEPDNVFFYVGPNANSPSSGDLYAVDALYPHPSYDGETYDAGLVHLAEPLSGVPVTPINTTALTQSLVGADVFAVGFGVSDGVYQSGGGVKRSTTLSLYDYGTATFVTEFDGSTVCFGDSGGPALLQLGGTWKVAGITSWGTSDDCRSGYDYFTRVDFVASWIAAYVDGGGTTDCNDDPGLCACDAACLANGACDDTLCGGGGDDLDCAGIYGCMVDCGSDGSCQQACYDDGTPAGQTAVYALLECLDDHCADARTDAEFQTCAEESCGAEVDACFGGGGGDPGEQSCEEAYGCMVECGTQSCVQGCYAQADATAQGQLDDLFDCLDSSCGTITDQEEYSDCAWQSCTDPILTCLPPASCDILGGGCPAGEACYLIDDTWTDCYESDGLAEDAACDATVEDRLVCADGLYCREGEDGAAACVPYCREDSDCAVGETCALPVDETVPDVGTCAPGGGPGCTDADDDGHCAADDCDDSDAAVAPGRAERCGNGRDDDCDGATDEGCDGPGCTDADADGVCAADDCDDSDATVAPGRAERCGDGRDDDCDGETDEGCDGTCTDADRDGYCATVDCDESAASRHPGAPETCGDAVDDDCDGETDEGCAGAGGDGGDGGDGPGGGGPDGDDDTAGDGEGSSGCSATGSAPARGAGLFFGLLLAAAGLRVRRARAGAR